jgi:DNA-binding transcriptional ArsR family regulator
LARVVFTADDVARTRFSPSPAPLMETMMALAELRRASTSRVPGRAAPWLREARMAFPATARPLLDLTGPDGPWLWFPDSLNPDIDQALDGLRALPADWLRLELSAIWEYRPGQPPAWVRQLAGGDREAWDLFVRALSDLHAAIVAPRWDCVVSAFYSSVASRMPVLAAGGHERLFGSLDPRLRWREDGLERSGVSSDWEVKLAGAGLLIQPLALWGGPPVFSCDDIAGEAATVLMYSCAAGSQLTVPGAKGAGSPATDTLAALMGPTRAAVLRALRVPRGTAELAETVRISPASASEHAKILRDASLIETRRAGRSVRHSLTTLGAAVLGQLPADINLPGVAGIPA